MVQNPPQAQLTYVNSGEIVDLKFGQDIFEGDLIFCDWDADGKKYDHSTIIWDAKGDSLSVDTVVKCAHWEPNRDTAIKAESLKEFGGVYRIRIAHW